MTEQIKGVAAGVPFVAIPPAGGSRDAPVVLAWHLLDPPRTETALAAALPLQGLEAWRIYLGLPMSGARLPAGGHGEFMRLGAEDAVLNLHKPITYGAAEEAGPALADLRRQLGLGDGPIGLLGGSGGAAAAQLVLAETEIDASAVVLVNPVIQLGGVVAAVGRHFGIEYPWTDESHAVADRIDFLARVDEIAGPPFLIVTGEEDEQEIREPAAQLGAALAQRYGDDERARLVGVPGMAHPLADEPGMEPAPQTPHAAVVDRHAVDWFRRHLIGAR